MPYVDALTRKRLDAGEQPQTEGELNYCITKLLNGWLQRKGRSYATINAVVGALECAKLEAYRRVAAPYEDAKRAQSGDVYGGW